MPNIHFIINARSVNATLAREMIASRFSTDDYQVSVKFSQYKGHAIDLARESVSEDANCIVACGGDGTVNEVARCLVGTSIVMGILPIGSGNGLARHLGLPTNMNAALELFKRRPHKMVDVGQVNGHYFFSNLSVAFSARVIQCYEELKGRGIRGYYRAFFKALSSFTYAPFELNGDFQPMVSTPFILMVSNTAQLGYNRSLTPDASLFDGKLDVIRVERSHPFRLALFMAMAMFGRFPSYFNLNRIQVEKLCIKPQGKSMNIQVDGEKFETEARELHISVVPAALKVVC